MSLATLQRVGGEFDLSITELLALPSEGDRTPSEPRSARVETFEQCASETVPVRRGAGTLYHLLGGGKGHLLQPYILSFLPGGGFTADSIAHPGEEFAYVVVGEVEMLIGEDVHRLQQGDAIRFSTDVDHSFRNASSTGLAVVIGAATPPW